MKTSLLPLALVLVPLGLSSAQTPDLPSAPRARDHVLRLVDGTVLRGRARPTSDGDWEFRSGREWTRLPGHLVAAAAVESELLREARRLASGVEKDDLPRRAMYADWLVTRGLQPEALLELDRILTLDPDQDQARAVLARADLPVALPPLETSDGAPNTDAFLAAAARFGPAVRELAVARLAAGTDELPEHLQEELLAELVHREAARRAFAAFALRRLAPGTHLRPLLRRALLDVSTDVRDDATRALRDANDETLVVPIVRALSSGHDVLRLHAVQALGTLNDAAAVEPLYRHMVTLQSGGAAAAPRSHVFFGKQTGYVQDFDVEVAQNSAVADPVINVLTEGVVLDAAVVGVHEYVVQRERAAVRRSLTRLTGADPGNTTRAWKQWWKQNGASWSLTDSSLRRPSSPSRDR